MPDVYDKGGSVPTAALRFPKCARLRARREFLLVQQHGRRVHSPHFIFVVMPADQARLGVTVTKRIAGAVGRNRVKRVVRSLFRQERLLFPLRCDVVVIAKRGAHELGYAEVRREFLRVQGHLRRVAATARRGPGAT